MYEAFRTELPELIWGWRITSPLASLPYVPQAASKLPWKDLRIVGGSVRKPLLSIILNLSAHTTLQLSYYRMSTIKCQQLLELCDYKGDPSKPSE